MKKAIITIVIILTLVSSGCVSNNNLEVGKYADIDNPKSYFLLNHDGTINRKLSDGRTMTGTYEMIDSNHMKITYLPFGEFYILEKIGNSFVYESGAIYEKVT